MMDVQTAMALVEKHARHVDYAPEYGEPGYTNPERGILFANWNDVPRYIGDALERRGFELEWSDEWLISYETGKAYRSSPDSHGWTPYYVMRDNGDIIGGDEIELGDESDWYVNQYLLNNPRHCNVFRKLDLAAHGFKQAIADCETGFHPGQTDSPKEMFARAQKEYPAHDVVFSLDSQGQFDTHWSVWVRPHSHNDNDCE